VCDNEFCPTVFLKMKKGFRAKYSVGVDTYYSSCSHYSNPHSSKFAAIIEKVISWLPFNLKESSTTKPVLDLACGSGQITKLLILNGIENVLGLDPHLGEQYRSEVGKPVFNNSFEDICHFRVVLPKCSLIICSYALHLCADLLNLLTTLKLSCDYLCVISPHGLPHIPPDSGWTTHFDFKYANIKVHLYTTYIHCIPFTSKEVQSDDQIDSEEWGDLGEILFSNDESL
jgi:SAM-dependent methyltransferase